jgi:hypothetical protein
VLDPHPVPTRAQRIGARVGVALLVLLAVAFADAQAVTASGPPGGPIADRMAPGAVIELPAGRFRLTDTPVVEGDLVLRGAGRDATILEAGAGEAVHVRAGSLTLEGVTLVAAGTDPSNLVFVEDASFEIRDARFESADTAPAEEDGALGPGGNGLYASDATGVVERSAFAANEKYGLFVVGASSVQVRDVEVRGGLAGLRVSGEGTNVQVRRAVIEDPAEAGFIARDTSVVTLEDVTVRRPGEVGIILYDEVDATVRRATIEDSAEGGVALVGTGAVRIEDLTSRRNGFSGILVEAGAPTLLDVTLLDNAQAGLAYFNDAAGTADGVEARGNGIAGLAFLGTSAPTLTNVTSTGNDGVGLHAEEGADPTFGAGLVVSDNAEGASNRDDLAERVASEPPTRGPSEAEPLDSLLAAGGEIRLPEGTFVVAGDVTPVDDLRLIGAGRDATRVRILDFLAAGIAAVGVDVFVQDVTLVVDAPADSFHVGDVLSVMGGSAIVRDVAIVNETEGDGEISGIGVDSGSLSAHELVVEGFSYAGIDVRGGVATLRDVTATANRNGVEVGGLDGSAIADVRDSDLRGNRLAGVAVFEEGSASVRGGRIAENGTEAVYVASGGRATLVGVEIVDHPQHGLFADGGEIDAREVTLARNRNAVWALLDSRVIVEDSEITDDAGFGVAGNGTGSTTLRDVTITDAAFSGIVAEERRSLTLERVASSGAAESGLFLVDESSATVSGSRFEDNGVNGVETRDAASLTLRDSAVIDNEAYGLQLAGDGPHTVERVYYGGNVLGDVREPDGGVSRQDASTSPDDPDATPSAPDRQEPGPAAGAAEGAGEAPRPWEIDDSSGEPYAFAIGSDAGLGLGCDANGTPFAMLFVYDGPAFDRTDFRADDGGEPLDVATLSPNVHQLLSNDSSFAAAEDLIFTARFQDAVTLSATVDGTTVPLLTYEGGAPFQESLDQLPCMP